MQLTNARGRDRPFQRAPPTALATLRRREFIVTTRDHATATSRHHVLGHWRINRVATRFQPKDKSVRCAIVAPVHIAAIFMSGERPTGAVATADRICVTPYFVANGGRFIRSTQLTSRFFASPLSRNSIAIRLKQSGSSDRQRHGRPRE